MKQVELLRTEHGFESANDDAFEQIKNYPIGSYILADLVKPRNPEFHRLFMGFIRFGYNMWDVPDEVEVDGIPVPVVKSYDYYREQVLIKAGHSEIEYIFGGDLRVVAKSVNYASMDDGEIRELFKRVKDAIWNLQFRSMKGWTQSEYENAVLQFMSY